jgi:hypothetical protein
MTDERQHTPRTSADDAAPPLDAPASRPAGPPARQRRGVAGGRIAAAGIGIAAMVGLVTNMEVANGRTSAAPAKGTGPAPTLSGLHAGKSRHAGSSTRPWKTAQASARRPIVLTPHAVVHTVGGGSGGGSGGSYASGSYAAPAPAAPVASTGGSH